MKPNPLRLFALRDTTTGRTVPNLFFSDKQQAKAARDKAVKDGMQLCVTLGPDHRRYAELTGRQRLHGAAEA